MKKRSFFSTIVAVAAVGVLLAGCGSSSSSKSKKSSADSNVKITAVGSTALQPLVEQAASNYQKANKGVNISVQGGGSGTGLSQVQTGAVQIGNSDIFAEQQDGIKAKKLVDHQVAVVGMTPVVNKDVNVSNLTMAQLKGIFTGKYTNWKQVGGKNEKITVVNRAQGSGTRATFESAVLEGAKAVKAQEQDSNGTVQKIVSSTPGTISYLAFSYVNSKLKALSVNNVKPTDANVTTNKWKIWSYEHMYTKGQPNKATKKFLNYMDSSKVQDSLVQKLGYISIHDMKVTKNASNAVSEK
ncbi:phosphate ABC transporter substrate-binding protein PstS family protein [Lentilactobacillus buchneri]|uniref:Phosphate-binding protein n=1 Tax=Lentilactobacillus buchneri DSM 20057 TaxID=1423728 RepID=A0A4R5NSD9_LENBU|nr:phosphate ABC transporter substrate-binding protein PstS family protein [Lentilactobacillus buchneri]WCJ50878.1 phosphate ABC transporter substrate-binding protein PstS family protein [Lentilactobacillus sp. Egmn17]AEB74578.1 phosphate binding protein [Lentilactobacillus buchneri NRRL B-30929]KRK68742.1 phosphate binding protein [Lentilactobacillus buchneri DSM 20057]MCT2881987.1 phosphate ABC transporter substrate-binding protein PstS family protein [Lentilactobacillus buchneri]MCT2898149.